MPQGPYAYELEPPREDPPGTWRCTFHILDGAGRRMAGTTYTCAGDCARAAEDEARRLAEEDVAALRSLTRPPPVALRA